MLRVFGWPTYVVLPRGGWGESVMPLNERCEAIATIVADYRLGEIPPMDAAHVRRWIDQFPADVREPLAAEVAHILSRSYWSRDKVARIVGRIVDHYTPATDAAAFWKATAILDVQRAGNSQRDLLAIFDQALRAKTGLGVADCGKQRPKRFFYLDDALFSGGRIKSDLIRWIGEDAPASAELIVSVIAIHEQGQWFAKKDLAEAAATAGKTIDIQWGAAIRIEDGIFRPDVSDVLRPTGADDPAVAAYVATLNKEQTWRNPGQQGALALFTGERGRALVEQEFLRAGVRVRDLCPRLPDHMRPLGSSLMRTTGFGTMFVTYRNCANNAPLVLWAGNPWYPPFPRKTN